jgi:hypothetical protein
MRYALNEDEERIEAGSDAPEAGVCEACGWAVRLRSRRVGRDGDRTWFYRHTRGAPDDCPLHGGPPGIRASARHPSGKMTR